MTRHLGRLLAGGGVDYSAGVNPPTQRKENPVTRDSVRRAIRTFVITSVGLLIPGLFGWLNALTEWARAEGQAPFPDARSLAYAGVVAIVAGFLAAVNLLWNTIEDVAGAGLLRTPSARVRRNDVGQSALYIALTVLVVLVIVWLVLGLR